MDYGYSYQILQELQTQGNVLDRLEEMMIQQNSDMVSLMSKVDQCLTVMTLLAVIGFGIFAFNVIMKWVKK